MVTLCTTKLNIKKLYIKPTGSIHVFVWSLEQTVIIPSYTTLTD